MKIISHRGNLTGPEPAAENSLKYIQRAVEAGFNVEVDLRLIGSEFYFGHDGPQYKVDGDWIDARKDKLLLHVKEFEVLKQISMYTDGWHYICHTSDPFTITSLGFAWLHDLSLEPDAGTYIPLITLESLKTYSRAWLLECYGICTDFPIECRKMRP